jgi:hypothetical protein
VSSCFLDPPRTQPPVSGDFTAEDYLSSLFLCNDENLEKASTELFNFWSNLNGEAPGNIAVGGGEKKRQKVEDESLSNKEQPPEPTPPSHRSVQVIYDCRQHNGRKGVILSERTNLYKIKFEDGGTSLINKKRVHVFSCSPPPPPSGC